MNKEQQIKEITEVMVNYGLKRLGEFTETELQVFLDGGKVLEKRNNENIISDFATAIYNAGYRKVPYRAVDEITRLTNVQVELQELNIKYYNEAKDLRRELAEAEKRIAELENGNKELAKQVVKITGCSVSNEEVDYECNKKLKQFAEKLKKVIHIDYVYGYEEICLIKEIDELLKEYEK